MRQGARMPRFSGGHYFPNIYIYIFFFSKYIYFSWPPFFLNLYISKLTSWRQTFRSLDLTWAALFRPWVMASTTLCRIEKHQLRGHTIFISYRVATEHAFACDLKHFLESVFDCNVFLDADCLVYTHDWARNFLQELRSDSVVLVILLLSNGGMDRFRTAHLATNHDNFLLEIEHMVVRQEQGLVSILPILLGDRPTFFRPDHDQKASHPEAPKKYSIKGELRVFVCQGLGIERVLHARIFFSLVPRCVLIWRRDHGQARQAARVLPHCAIQTDLALHRALYSRARPGPARHHDQDDGRARDCRQYSDSAG